MPLLLALLLLVPLPAAAVVAFDDGDVHIIDIRHPGVLLSNETTVLALPGALILDNLDLAPGIESEAGSSVAIFGGSVRGRSGLVTSGTDAGLFETHSGIEARGGAVTITDGEVVGGRGGAGISAVDVGILIVSGGVVQGGTEGGDAVIAAGSTDAHLVGGEYVGGSVVDAASGLASALALTGTSRSTIRGGAFMGGSDQTAVPIGPSLRMDQTAFAEVRGGTFEGSWVIRGPDAVVEVFGRDLHFPPLSPEQLPMNIGSTATVATALSGELEDGSPISVVINLEDGAGFPVLHAVPEPAVAWLGATALATLALVQLRHLPSARGQRRHSA